MSLDADNDSQMLSSPSTTSSSPTTPPQIPPSSASNLSPPDSQHRTSKMSNANGKRPLNTISTEADEVEWLATNAAAAGAAKTKELPLKTHAGSGYTWRRPEDEPGFGWGNKKAVDEGQRAWEGVVHKDCMVRGESAFRGVGVVSRGRC